MIFIDTNVLLYTEDTAEPAKRARAVEVVRTLMKDGTGVISTQVLNEFYANAVGKLRVDRAVARRLVRGFASLRTVPMTTELLLGAIDLHQVEQISFWDALIVRAASSSGCDRVFTEDLSDGRRIDGVRIVNPFNTSAPPNS